MKSPILPHHVCETFPTWSVVRDTAIEKTVRELTKILADNWNTRWPVSFEDYIARKKQHMKGQKKALSPMIEAAYNKARIYTVSPILATNFSNAWKKIEQNLIHGKEVRTFENN